MIQLCAAIPPCHRGIQLTCVSYFGSTEPSGVFWQSWLLASQSPLQIFLWSYSVQDAGLHTCHSELQEAPDRPSLQHIDHLLGRTHSPAEGILCPTVQVIHEGIQQCWPHCQSLRHCYKLATSWTLPLATILWVKVTVYFPPAMAIFLVPVSPVGHVT